MIKNCWEWTAGINIGAGGAGSVIMKTVMIRTADEDINLNMNY